MQVSFKRVVLIASFVAGAVGGVMIGSRPVSGGLLLGAGVIGTIYSFLSPETHQDEVDLMQETMAKLFIASGGGNPYTKLVDRKLSRGGVQYVIPDLERALELDPQDPDALAMYVGIGVLHLWLRISGEASSPPPAFADPERLRQMIKRGFETGKRQAEFFFAEGVLLDSFKRCQEARECFRRGSELSPNPYWRLYVCTSYGIEGKFDEALAEIELAIGEGAKGPATDFHYARCLAGVGEFGHAIELFEKVKRHRGLYYQLAVPMQQAYYFMWKPFRSAHYEMRAAFMVARLSPRKAARHLATAILHCFISPRVSSCQAISRVSKSIPLLKRSRAAKLCEQDEPYFSLGNSMLRKGQYTAAKKLYMIATERAPLARSYHNLCTAAIITGDWTVAENACLRYAEVSPGNPWAAEYFDRIRRRDSSVRRVHHLRVEWDDDLTR